MGSFVLQDPQFTLFNFNPQPQEARGPARERVDLRLCPGIANGPPAAGR